MTSRSSYRYFTPELFFKNRETEESKKICVGDHNDQTTKKTSFFKYYPEAKEESRKIYVGNLSDQTTKTVTDYFSQWGVIIKCLIMKRKEKHQGQFGFVTFQDTRMVDKTQAARPHVIDGKIVVTRRCIPQKNVGKPEAIMKVNKLFVGALRKDICTNDLREYFSNFGSITNIEIVRDERGKKGPFSIIEFDDYDPVDKVQFGKHFIKGHQVEVKKALTKKEMKIAERKTRERTLEKQWPSGTLFFIDRRRRSFQRKALGPIRTRVCSRNAGP